MILWPLPILSVALFPDHVPPEPSPNHTHTEFSYCGVAESAIMETAPFFKHDAVPAGLTFQIHLYWKYNCKYRKYASITERQTRQVKIRLTVCRTKYLRQMPATAHKAVGAVCDALLILITTGSDGWVRDIHNKNDPWRTTGRSSITDSGGSDISNRWSNILRHIRSCQRRPVGLHSRFQT